jgi:hypothetical protein
MRFVASPATEYDEVFSGCHLGHMVEQLVFSPLNHLTQLIAQENFIIIYVPVSVRCTLLSVYISPLWWNTEVNL